MTGLPSLITIRRLLPLPLVQFAVAFVVVMELTVKLLACIVGVLSDVVKDAIGTEVVM